jgi:hypothetical protein
MAIITGTTGGDRITATVNSFVGGLATGGDDSIAGGGGGSDTRLGGNGDDDIFAVLATLQPQGCP